MNEDLKSFKDLIVEIICYYDPAKLGSFGVPKNEYRPEAETIIFKLRDADDIRALKWILYDVSLQFFSKENIFPLRDERYQFMAEEIWDVWQEEIVISNHPVL